MCHDLKKLTLLKQSNLASNINEWVCEVCTPSIDNVVEFAAPSNTSTLAKHWQGAKRAREIEQMNRSNDNAMQVQALTTQKMAFATLKKITILEDVSIMALCGLLDEQLALLEVKEYFSCINMRNCKSWELVLHL